MDAHEMANLLAETLNLEAEVAEDDRFAEALDGVEKVREVVSYEDAGILTRDAGFVIRMHDGTEFQVTILRSM